MGLDEITDILPLVNVSTSESGIYICHAKDNNSANGTSFKLEVIPKIKISTNIQAKIPIKPCEEKEEKVDNDSNEMEWKIRVIVGACSTMVGIVMSMMYCVLFFSCKLCNKINRYGNSIYDDVSPRAAKERLRDNWPEKKESIKEAT